MTNETISDLNTVAGGGETLLANRYRVVRQLGQGGMGSVWLAEDTALENRQVAIKMLPAILVANRRALRQMKSEALVSMRLAHPNIVQVRSFEENDGNPFLVSDYVEGETLEDLIEEKGALSEEETVRLLEPVAAALDYAHGEGVVHRDVKPGNIQIRRDGRPFVLDFGIAREIQETLTRVTGALSSGTLLYMSPEQLHGAEPTAAQDVYSFAALAYECLAGHPPFHRGQIEYQILNDAPPPLASGTPLAQRILQGLAKDPTARPASCRAICVTAGAGMPQVEKAKTVDAIVSIASGRPEAFETNASTCEGKTVDAIVSIASGRPDAFETNASTRPVATPALGGVQLWENGPYWAECNVGASKPEEHGYYFWWGDTVGYCRKEAGGWFEKLVHGGRWNAVDGSQTRFLFSDENCPTWGKEVSQLRSAGFIDKTGNLVPAHDAATAHLGAPWRMPTQAELDALVANCTTEWTTRNGVRGRLVTGKGAFASRSIFLPAAGYGYGSDLCIPGSYGYFWSSTPYSDYSLSAWGLYFGSGDFYRRNYCRYFGQSVRPLRGFAT